MSTFSIEIDPTALFYRQFIVIGAGTSFIDSRQIQRFDLAAGSYPIQVQSGVYTDFSFRVTDAGTIDFDPAFDGFASGRGSTRLTLAGLEIGIDARGLSSMAGGGVLFASIPLTADDWIGLRRIRLLPQTNYMFQQGSGVVCDLSFALGSDGLIRYTPEQDRAQGGCLSGNGSGTLTLHGFALQIDASAVSRVLALPNVWGLQASFTGRLDVTVLPAASFAIQLDAGVSDAQFMVGRTGVAAPANAPADLRLQVEAGAVPLLRVLPPAAPAPEPLTDSVYDFGGFKLVIGASAQGVQRVSLLTDAGTAWLVDRRWLADKAAFSVKAIGNVRSVGQNAPPARHGQLFVTLSGSRWPGTALSADFALIVARSVTPDGVDIIVSMRWTAGNGSFDSDANWDGRATADLVISGPIAALGPNGSIDLVGGAAVQVEFRPGMLSLSGAEVARVKRSDGVLACTWLELDALAPDAAVLLAPELRSPLHSALRLQGAEPWPIALPGSQTPFGAIVAIADLFDGALLELGENPDGRRRQAVQFTTDASEPGFALGIAALVDAHAQALAVQIARSALFINHDSEPPQSRLRGLASTAPTWVRAQGVGLLFGPLPFDVQNNLDIAFDGASVGAATLRLGFGGVVPAIDGFVVEPLGAPALIDLLAPGSAPDPAHQRNALVVGAAGDAPPLLLRDFAFGLLRPQDLLRLRFDFTGLRLRSGAGATTVLEAEVAGQPGCMVVGLGPQHRAEEAFELQPGQAFGSLPVRMRLGGDSRLAFALASAGPSPMSTEFLLGWVPHALSVAPICDDRQRSQTPAPPTGLGGPGTPQTALELPYRLLLSPGSAAGFSHALQPAQYGPWTELWHTRLAARRASDVASGGFVLDERPGGGNDLARYLHALWSPDYTPALTGEADLVFRVSISAEQRARIVDAGADTQRHPAGGAALATPVLAMSSQGGWLHCDGRWDPVQGNPIVAWSHVAALGRDQHVQVLTHGAVFPFGHRATLTPVTNRVFRDGDDNVAGLDQTFVLDVLEAVHDAAGRPVDALFTRTEILLTQAQVTPDVIVASPLAAWLGGVRLPIRAWDALGNVCHFDAALIFIDDVGLQSPDVLKAVGAAYDTQRGQAARSMLNGERLAFAPEDRPGDTSFETRMLDFATGPAGLANGAAGLAFYPRVASARIELSALRGLASADADLAAGVEVRFSDAFMNSGFDTGANPAQVFLELASPVTIGFDRDKALGVASPTMGIGALSRHLGTAPPNYASMFPPGTPSVTLDDFFPPDAKLLGSIPLSALVGCIVRPTLQPDPPPPGAPSEVPVVKTETIGDGPDRQLVTRMAWQPRIAPGAAISLGLLTLRLNARGSTSTFALESIRSVRMDPSAGPGPGSARTTGRLTAFDLDFAGLATVRFDEFSFVAEDGRKPDTRLTFADPPIALEGQLDFLQVLMNALRGILGGGPSVDVGAAQIVAGYALALPDLPLGILSLSNIAIGVGVTIPLVGGNPTTFRFDFAQQHHPFCLTVDFLGGGGYFSLAVDSDGIRAIDLAVEAGASVALDLAGLASGSAYVMLGVSFHYSPGNTLIGGYLRAGGELTVLGVLSLHVEFYAGIVYMVERKVLHASVSVMVELTVACLSQSVSLTLERDFDVSNAIGSARPTPLALATAATAAPGIADAMTAADWAAYAAAFA